ncbi:hypothetical protein HG536_0D04500 [Torulaspora globosa]|uniref:arginyltransferase n=1 Tax=Torulaspora globosa TaxID=48254 RepID=A0A7G3ZHE2_9SACH|nr:uncharacterized protein HG536_0D04500 [Torulaspora globosa]QLL32928.1 hypothetical protein HG536_0D04500 [Torulaspora globosa]
MFEGFIISRPVYFTEPSSRCGYCSAKKSRDEDYYCLDSWYRNSVVHANNSEGTLAENCTLGFQAELLSVEMYDRLCNMGYRRSGKFIYKADMLRNCCRLYTIRTQPDLVIMSKELKHTLRRFSKRVLPSDKPLHRNPKGGCHYIDEIVETETLSKSFRTCFEPSVFTEEKYRLFAKYQEHVHNDFDHSARSFKRFLCDTPFSKETVLGTKEEWEQLNNWKGFKQGDRLKRLGPAHECYYFEGNLIAMAVTDILPSGLSSVYFIWDPEYYKWSLGKLSALRELSIVSKANLKYYYMGYYLDDCPKMSYKAKYGGGLLDVSTHAYISLDQVTKLKRPGKLFAVEATSKSEAEKTHSSEFTLNDALLHAPKSISETAALKNVAEEIYGVAGGAYSEANEAAQALASLGIPYAVDELPFHPQTKEPEENEMHNIPNVVPGLVPLKEVLQMIMKDRISVLEGTVTLYDLLEGEMRRLERFEDESPEIKKILCDVVRLIGLENARGLLLLL